MFKKFAIAAILAAAPTTMASASCVREQVANDHDAWVRGAPSLSGNPLWKLTPGSDVLYCGRHASDNRRDQIVWHWISFKSNQEPWDHDGWMSSRILEPANVAPQSNTPAVAPAPVQTQAALSIGAGASASESVMYGPTPKSEPNLSIPSYDINALCLISGNINGGRKNGINPYENACLKSEQASYDFLKATWDNASDDVKHQTLAVSDQIHAQSTSIITHPYHIIEDYFLAYSHAERVTSKAPPFHY